ncbi:MAG: hypothetical protein JJW00_05940 [Sulfurimonas sp.]|nr:hypothetical protein [Sulfurimonas sp.]
MLAIKIDNYDIEKKFFEYTKFKKQKIDEIVIEVMTQFLDKQKMPDDIVYTKKDPIKYMRKISYKYDEELCDKTALTHITDSAKYIHDLRRKKTI